MNVGSLFSGIGGLDLGLERAGFNIAWQVESDPFCQRILARHWPDVPRYGDIQSVDWARLAPVDLVCGGFPCQPVSVAGRGAGRRDGRWLWPEFARAVRILEPRWVLVENVRGLLQRGLADVLRDLALMGFDAQWGVLPAATFGAPHLRHRLYVVAHAVGEGLEVLQLEPAPEELAALERGGDGWRFWEVEPDVGRVVDGLSPSVDRVPRIKALGNAAVPQPVEWIGRRIMTAHIDGSQDSVESRQSLEPPEIDGETDG